MSHYAEMTENLLIKFKSSVKREEKLTTVGHVVAEKIIHT